MDLNNVKEITDRIQESLKSGKILIYIDKDFYLKDKVCKALDNRQEYLLIEDPEVMNLYRMYEFSDEIIVFSESSQYGSIWNYVRRGLLTAEEAIDALLDK